MYAKFWVLFIKDTFCSGLFLYNFETYQNYLIKSTIKGINFTLFHVQPYTLELSIRHFQTPKDQGYLKLTQKFEKIDIAQPQKCPFFNPKNPLCSDFYRKKSDMGRQVGQKRAQKIGRHMWTAPQTYILKWSYR